MNSLEDTLLKLFRARYARSLACKRTREATSRVSSHLMQVIPARRAPGREGRTGPDGTARPDRREGRSGKAREEGKLQRGPPEPTVPIPLIQQKGTMVPPFVPVPCVHASHGVTLADVITARRVCLAARDRCFPPHSFRMLLRVRSLVDWSRFIDRKLFTANLSSTCRF